MTSPLELPSDDRALSPHTGYTRAHWEAAADGLLRAAWQWSTPGRALLDLPGRPSGSGVRSDGLEGYARTFLAAAFRVAGADGKDPHGWLDRYADGLAAGTRTPGRDDPESWPLILDHHVQGQPMVESASVAIGLRLTRPWLWDRLDPGVQDRAEEWLRGALRHTPAPNNWYLFPYSVAAFLESVGRGDAETTRAKERALDLLEGWYRGQGWYSDGDGAAFDHYNGWALHLYPVLDAHLSGDPELSAHYGSRLREHLDSFSLLFGGDGAPIHFGRSLTYRFAAGSAVALGAVTGHTPLSPGASRRVISGSLRYFLDRGATGTDGLLSLGWHGPHEATLQHYSGPASPYWASKAFVSLLAPESHPLWTATEEPAPSEGPDRVLALPAPGLLIQSTRSDGIVRLHNHGSDHVRPHEGESGVQDDPLYSRQSYSTVTGPTSKVNAADNHLAVVVAGARSGRRSIRALGAGQGDGWGWAASWHRPVFTSGAPMVPGLRVESVTVVRGRYELRAHRVLGAPAGARVEQTGWATGPDDAVRSALHGLHGWETSDEVRAPQGTAYSRWAVVPRLGADAEGTVLLVSLASLTAEPDATALAAAVSAVNVDGDTVEVGWAEDGATTRIDFEPLKVEHR
ncbi:DUF2264 domain-containing protein [Streptomyces sp. NBC_00121]|uniref:DUF2264 domain-containing protein n=1 Tax=unclassified Streptomyces TaxID=2593676 RepID=UPI0028C50A16|nr:MULTISPECIES: DUF2264 domain-containing protein [unclassified Streptomyces]WNO68405.1 DUF2264 domain-containing protein [Streptomyces sp. AM2-3-1]WSC73060.1 DUF2264 domain-containing protein [Streptomyces sp. NBC_01760]WTE63504.1 DUF2264 domain-containing protein [Streptomyces sp. NBC_01617]WTI90789.1 DUF2264 domain-containing protein [Streptomyces sp. NBC_00724]